MGEYRIDAIATATQHPILYLNKVAGVSANADVSFFLDSAKNVVAVANVTSRIAFASVVDVYRVDAMPTAVQQTVLYLHGISSVVNNADVILFIDGNGQIVATAPDATRIAFVLL